MRQCAPPTQSPTGPAANNSDAGPENLASALRLDSQLCFAVHSTAHAIARAYRPLLDPIGLTYPQYLVLLVLWQADGQTVSEIGARLLLDSGTLTPLLKRLEAAGYLNRRRSEHDERQVVISLTESGRILKNKAACIPGEMARAMGQPLADLMALRDRLNALRAALSGNGEPSHAPAVEPPRP
jgi:MarR family transcriptional regulator, organic hydroperoxide resistance regulator